MATIIKTQNTQHSNSDYIGTPLSSSYIGSFQQWLPSSKPKTLTQHCNSEPQSQHQELEFLHIFGTTKRIGIQKHKRGEAKKKHWAGCGVVENCNSSPSSSSKGHDDDRNKGSRATTTTMSNQPPKLLCVLFQYTTWSLLPGTQWYQFWMIIIPITAIITILFVLFQYTRSLLPGTNTNSWRSSWASSAFS